MSFSLVWKLASHLRLTYILSPKNIESKATLDRKKIWVRKTIGQKYSYQLFISTNLCVKRNVRSYKLMCPQNLCRKNVYKTYRVSTKTVPTFVSWYSRLPRGLEIPSWDIFQQHFPYRFQKNFIIWWNLDQDRTRTNIAWINVDGTNIPKTLANSCRLPKHQTFKFRLSFDQ